MLLNRVNRNANKALALYKHLLRECEKLPEAPGKHYRFMVKQSFKQHIQETDAERIAQIISRANQDALWIKNKYLGTQSKIK